MDFLLNAIIYIFIIQILFFIIASYFKTDKVTDLSYGLTFVLIALYYTSKNFTAVNLILSAMIVLWGLRLSVYLFNRILLIKKDSRFDGIREKFFAFAKFWTLQAAAIWIIMLPSLVLFDLGIDNFEPGSWLGLIIWSIGLTIETIADQQKFSFKKKHKNKWIESGLWKYSRHPNYFGETLVWWGIYFYAFPYLNIIGKLSIIGPIFITLLLLFVTGIPPLEKSYDLKYGKDSLYKAYKKRTSIYIPWRPK